MARSETVEEVKERNFGFKRRKVCDQSEIHNLLNGVGREHRKTRLTACHNVRMVAENVKRMSSQSSRAYVENAGEKFARDFVHVRDHEEKTLRSGVGNRQSTCRKRSVNRACRACFGLHFRKFEFLTEHISSACGRPLVRNFRHRRGRSDRVNRRNFRERISYVARGGVTVNSHNFH